MLVRPLFLIESPRGFKEDREEYDKFKEWFSVTIKDYDLCIRDNTTSKRNYFNFDAYGPINTEFPMQRVVKLVSIYLKKNKLIE